MKEMTEKTRVAIVLPYFGPGGAEKTVFQLALGLNRSQFDIRVFCVYGQPQGNFMEQELQDKGVQIHYIGKKKGFSLSAVWKLFCALDQFAPDVIHTHQYACMYAALWPVVRKKPFLHTLHTLPETENRRFLRRLLTRQLVKTGKMIPVSISARNREMVALFYGRSVEEVPMVQNPVDLNRFTSVDREDDGKFRYITAGRFSPEKNQQMMYRAFAAFLEKGYDASLLMLGTGQEEENLRALAQELDISDRIYYAGYVSNVEDYLKKAKVFLLSSYYEAQPLCVLEAMAAGLPVIATDVGGLRDIVTDNGILIPSGDTEAMTAAMERLYTDKTLYETMSACSFTNAATYDVSNTVAGYSRLYHHYTGEK